MSQISGFYQFMLFFSRGIKEIIVTRLYNVAITSKERPHLEQLSVTCHYRRRRRESHKLLLCTIQCV